MAVAVGAACIGTAAAQSPDARALCANRDLRVADQSIEACSQIIASSPKDSAAVRMALFARARTNAARGEWARVAPDVDQLLELDSTSPVAAEVYALRATARYQATDYAGAIADCEAALKLNPRNEQALRMRSLAHVARGMASSNGGFATLPDALVVYVAQGPAGACGENCQEWLAVEGTVDRDGPRRVIAALDRLGAQKIPVVLNFRGRSGFYPTMSIGRLLRERGFDASVGQTVVDGCVDPGEERCMTLKRSGKPLQASLVPSPACDVVCVLGLVGGVRRSVPVSTRVVLSGGWSRNAIGTSTIPEFREGRRVQFLGLARAHFTQLGIDPRVADMIDENAESSRTIELSREDVARLGIVTAQ